MHAERPVQDSPAMIFSAIAPRRRWRRPAFGLIVGAYTVVACLALAAVHAAPARAAAFSCNPGQDFVSVDGGAGGTQLYAETDGPTGANFNPLGSPFAVAGTAASYNALGYDTVDNFLYAWTRTDTTTGATLPAGTFELLRINSAGTAAGQGTVTFPGLGGSLNTAAFDGTGSADAGTDYVTNDNETAVWEVNPATVSLTGQIALSGANGGKWPANDFAFSQGFLWGMDVNASGADEIWRLDLSTGVISGPWPITGQLPGDAAGFGAAWTYGSQNLGFMNNTSRNIYEIAVSNASAATPTFTTVQAITTSFPTGGGDGAACPGLPVDLGITKLGPATVAAGGTITWTLTVTNDSTNGGISSGFAVNDAVPAGVTAVKSTTPGCTVTGNDVACNGGVLNPGASEVVTITGTAPSTSNTCVTNVATVTGQQLDLNPANNTSNVVQTCTPPSVDLALGKALEGGGPLVPGTNATYDLTVTNNGPDNSTGSTVSDPLPAGLSFVSSSTGCTAAGANVSCAVGALAAGAPAVTEKVTVAVGPGVTGPVTNTATVAGNEPDPNMANNTASVTNAAAPSVDLALGKTLEGGGPLVPGTQATYDLTVTNNGPSNSSGSTIADTLPAGLSFAFSSTGCTAAGANVSCAVGGLGVGASVTEKVTVAVDPGVTTSVMNTATVTGNEPDPNTANNTASVTNTVAPQADVAIVKALGGGGPLVPGTDATYELTVTNNGPSNSSGSTIADTLPPGLSFVSSTTGCTAAGPIVSCADGALGVGASVTETITVAVDAGVTTPVANTATVVGKEPDPNAANNTSTVTNPVTPKADLAIDKTLEGGAMVPGTDATYDLVVTNNGPSNSSGSTIADTLPAGLSFVSSPTGCTAAGPVVSCGDGGLIPGASVTEKIVVAVDSSVTGSVTNTATVTGNEPDPNTANNVSSSTVNVTPEADLAIVKTAEATLVPGTDETYDLAVTNNGPSNATKVAVSDPMPSGLTFVSSATGCTAAAGTVTCAVGALAAGGSVTEKITVAVASNVTAPVSNTATVAGFQLDPNPANNTSTDVETPHPKADLAIVKTAETSPVVSGTDETYDLVVTNNGPSDAADVSVTDTLASNLTFVSASTGCSNATGTVTCTSGALTAITPNNTKTFKVTVLVSSAATGNLSNMATVSSTTLDPDTSNNSSTTTTPTKQEADLAIVKTAETNPVVSGTDETYDLVVTNNGPSDAQAVSVSDPVPTGTSFVSAAKGCTQASGTVTCAGGTLSAVAPSNTEKFTITVLVDSAVTGNVANTATVSSGTPDPVMANNTSSVTIPTKQEADLAIVKTAETSPVVSGTDETYDLTVTNKGPSDAADVTVVDPLPAGTTFVSASTGCTLTNGTVTCTGPALSAKPTMNTEVFKVTVLVASSTTGNIPNTATVSSTTPDPDTSNNSSTTSTTTQQEADLAIVKTPASVTGEPGTDETYTLTVTNNGPSDAQDVVATDQIPAGTTFVSASPGCTEASGIVTCTDPMLSAIVPNNVVSYQVTVLIGSGATGNSVNTAGVQSTTPDPNLSNNGTQVTLPLKPQAQLTIVKTAKTPSVAVGHEETYMLQVTNHGPSDATDVKVTDTLPAGLTFVSASSGCSHAGQTVTCLASSLSAAAGSNVITFSVTVLVGFDVGPRVINTATVTSSNSPPSSGSVPVGTITTKGVDILFPRLHLRKVASVAKIANGGEVTYTLVLSNSGRAAAEQAKLCDQLPAGTTIVTADHGRLRAGQLCWTVKAVRPGHAIKRRVTLKMAASDLHGAVVNRASASALGSRPVHAHTSVTVIAPVAPPPGGVTG